MFSFTSEWVVAVSAVLVTQSTIHSSFKASALRVCANLAGALVGALFLATLQHPLVAMALGVLVTGLGCYLIRQDEAQRPASVAVILVTLIGKTRSGTMFATVFSVSSSVVHVLLPVGYILIVLRASSIAFKFTFAFRRLSFRRIIPSL